MPEPDRSASPAPSVDETVIAELWAKSIVPGMTPGMTIKPQASPFLRPLLSGLIATAKTLSVYPSNAYAAALSLVPR